jgi:hypothetical protein
MAEVSLGYTAYAHFSLAELCLITFYCLSFTVQVQAALLLLAKYIVL